MKFSSFKGFILTLLSASVLGQKPADIDYDYDPPAQSGGQREVPIFVNVYDHPKTGFSCADKQAGNYYADPETKCAVYYVCIANAQNILSPQSFACPNGTLFQQSTRVCASHDQVYCQLSTRYYDNVNGNIDSKGQEEHHRPAALQPWRKNEPRTRPQSQPQPTSAKPPSPQPQTSRRGGVTSTTAAPEYEYEYVDYNETNTARPSPLPARTRREAPPARRKGQLPLPFDFLTQSHVITSFKCEDKVPGIAYADEETDCKMFHVCIPFAKGKLRDYQLYCDENKAFNQETALCELRENVNCSRSRKFYVYNKWFRPQESKKDSWIRFIKKSALKS